MPEPTDSLGHFSDKSRKGLQRNAAICTQRSWQQQSLQQSVGDAIESARFLCAPCCPQAEPVSLSSLFKTLSRVGGKLTGRRVVRST